MTWDRNQRRALRDSLPDYSQACLTIRTRDRGLSPLCLNRAQMVLHRALEKQKAETGRVRALVLKYRQGGLSTYVAARHFHRLTHSRGLRGFILTHRQDATEHLFSMVTRFYGHLPDAVKPALGNANAKSLHFSRLDSGYRVATAGGRETGRGETVQLFHGSEVAFWPKADSHLAGVMNAVPDGPDTEIILESTANGLGGVFYEMCMAAEKGQSEFILVFLPWFLEPVYRRKPETAGWTPSRDWEAYGQQHGLDREQLFWAWRKNQTLARGTGADPEDGPCWKFRQEFPATAQEAFQTGGSDGLVSSETVMTARRLEIDSTAPDLPMAIGVDVARGGGDLSWAIDRVGRKMGGHINERRDSRDMMEIAGWCAGMITRFRPERLFIDAGGNGAAVYDRLVELGHGNQAALINFGQRADEPGRFANKRAEMWWRLKEWLEDPGGADLPDDDLLHRHICAPGWKETSAGLIQLEAKDSIRERTGFSPDGGDAAALTFAFALGGAGRRAAAEQEAGEGAYDPFAW